MKTKSKMQYLALTVFLACTLGATWAEEKFDPTTWDPDMVVKNAVVEKGVKWIDGKFLPLEGRVFSDVEHPYDRLPANVTTNVNAGVRNMKHYTSGMRFRFATDSDKVTIRWTPYFPTLSTEP